MFHFDSTKTQKPGQNVQFIHDTTGPAWHCLALLLAVPGVVKIVPLLYGPIP